MTYIPPLNFGYVEADIFRSAEPVEYNFPFLETLRLRTVISLSPDAPSRAFKTWMRDQAIEFEQIVCQPLAQQQVTEDLILTAMRLLLQPDARPILVCCNLGRHRTGTLIGCFRKLQNWNLTAILSEYRRYCGAWRTPENEQFIELFDTDLVSPPPPSSPHPPPQQQQQLLLQSQQQPQQPQQVPAGYQHQHHHHHAHLPVVLQPHPPHQPYHQNQAVQQGPHHQQQQQQQGGAPAPIQTSSPTPPSPSHGGR